MDKLVAGFMLFVIVLGGAFALAMLMAYPTMWVVNYLFTAQLLIFVFGVAKIGFWQAFILNTFFSLAFGRQTYSSSKSS